MFTELSARLVFAVLSLVCFALSFFNTPRFNWTAGGFFFALLVLLV